MRYTIMRFVFALALAALAAALLASRPVRSINVTHMVTSDPQIRAAIAPGDLDHAEGW